MTGSEGGVLGWPRQGWRLVLTLGGTMLGLAGATLALYGVSDATLGVVARNAARISLVLFSLTFAAAPLARFFPGKSTRWLVEHRPFLGVSFAISHLIFLGSHVVRVFVVHDGDFFALRSPIAWYGGAVLYGFILAMAVTSFPGPAARLGRRGWKVLHATGSYAIALTFLNSYGFRALVMPEYLPAVGLVLAVLGLRLTALAHRRSRPVRAMLDTCLRACRAG